MSLCLGFVHGPFDLEEGDPSSPGATVAYLALLCWSVPGGDGNCKERAHRHIDNKVCRNHGRLFLENQAKYLFPWWLLGRVWG